jgi:TNF receptor-associated factor 4
LLQASIFLNGNGAGESSHISAYIKILPGEYDALLRWPFSHSVSFTLFDQSNAPEKVSPCLLCHSYLSLGFGKQSVTNQVYEVFFMFFKCAL